MAAESSKAEPEQQQWSRDGLLEGYNGTTHTEGTY